MKILLKVFSVWTVGLVTLIVYVYNYWWIASIRSVPAEMLSPPDRFLYVAGVNLPLTIWVCSAAFALTFIVIFAWGLREFIFLVRKHKPTEVPDYFPVATNKEKLVGAVILSLLVLISWAIRPAVQEQLNTAVLIRSFSPILWLPIVYFLGQLLVKQRL